MQFDTPLMKAELKASQCSIRASLAVLAKWHHKMMCFRGFWDQDDRILEMQQSNTTDEMRRSIMSEKVSLLHTEVSEIQEGIRKPGPSDKLGAAYEQVEEEAGDVLLRLLDFCERYNIDLVGATIAKMQYNADRPHMHGKKA